MRRPSDPRLDAAIGELLGELFFDLARSAVLLRSASAFEPRGHDVVGFRIELAERQVLEFLAHLLHAHAAGERRIDFQRLLGDAAARFGRHVAERAHVVQAVGELDQQHAHVVGDRQQQLAEVLRLLGFLGDEFELLQLGQALDQRADIVAEQLSISARVASVSSMVSCKSAAAMVASSSLRSVRIAATSSGWEK